MPAEHSKPNNLVISLRRKSEAFLWDTTSQDQSMLLRTAKRVAQILYAIVRDIAEGQISLRAMSLVYSTILGFVPLVALTFAVLKSLGIHNAMEPFLLTLLEALGDRRENVVAEIIGFVDNIRVDIIGISSLGILIFLVLDMMRKIESSFNYIWSVNQERSWSNRVSEYLFAVIVSPVLLFISISLTSSFNTLFFSRFVESLAFGSAIVEFFAVLVPLLFMSLAFAFAYSFLPNTRVKFSSALIGGIVTTIVWKMMGAFFQSFFINAARDSIYLAFATVLAVMVFTYFGWLVALLGGDIAYYHQYPARARTGRKLVPLSILQQEHLALAIAALVIHRFENKLPALIGAELVAKLGTGAPMIENALVKLISIGLLRTTSDEPAKYLPAVSVSNCKIADIWSAVRTDSASALFKSKLPELQQVNAFIQKVDSEVGRALGDSVFTAEIPADTETKIS